MRRLHLFEFEDLAWVPRPIRDGGTDLLDLAFARVGFYRALADELAGLIEASGERSLVDVCSGGGGGALTMHALLRERGGFEDVQLTLTERHPNAAAIARVQALGDANLRYEARSIDALAVPGDLQGIRTMYGALHHFEPEGVQAVIAGAVADRMPIALFDVAASPMIRRTPIVFAPLLAIPNLLMLFVATLIGIPFVRPFRWSRILFTYGLPAIPVLFAWDGTVSALRAYSAEELLAMARAVPGGDSYEWTAKSAGTALCLIGRAL